MTNAMLVISPYHAHGTWVFDDPTRGLVQEPFVCGIPQMIDRLVEHIPNARQGFRLISPGSPFPGFQQAFEWVREESGGNWYRSSALEMEGWLCPALFKYFDEAPRRIYARAEPIETR